MEKLFNYLFKPEPQNRKVFLFFIDGKIRGYSLCGNNERKDRIISTLYCLRNELRGILILKTVSASYMGYLAKNYKLLKQVQ